MIGEELFGLFVQFRIVSLWMLIDKIFGWWQERWEPENCSPKKQHKSELES